MCGARCRCTLGLSSGSVPRALVRSPLGGGSCRAGGRHRPITLRSTRGRGTDDSVRALCNLHRVEGGLLLDTQTSLPSELSLCPEPIHARDSDAVCLNTSPNTCRSSLSRTAPAQQLVSFVHCAQSPKPYLYLASQAAVHASWTLSQQRTEHTSTWCRRVDFRPNGALWAP